MNACRWAKKSEHWTSNSVFRCVFTDLLIFLFWLLLEKRLFAMIFLLMMWDYCFGAQFYLHVQMTRDHACMHKHMHTSKQRVMMGLPGFWLSYIAKLLTYFQVAVDCCTICTAYGAICGAVMWLKGGFRQSSYFLGDNISARFHSSIIGISRCCGCLLFQINIHLNGEQCYYACVLCGKVRKEA